MVCTCANSAAQDASDGGVPAAAVPREDLEALACGAAELPCSGSFPLPEPLPCPGGCGEERYCSSDCSEADWRHSHCLLCTGAAGAPPGAGPDARRRAEQLRAFNEHADETNDVFRLAAKVIAHVLLEARQALEAAAPSGSGASRSGGGQAAAPTAAAVAAGTPVQCWAALRAAWQPFRMGHKALWWECVPDSVEEAQLCRDGESLGGRP